MTNEYHPTGELKRTSGSRTYPVEYAYDTAGRLKTNTTWQNFATGVGAAKTVWNYDAWSGFLVSKRYDDGKGPDYTYATTGSTGKGRLNKRFWSRGSTATYSYTAVGELSGWRGKDRRLRRLGCLRSHDFREHRNIGCFLFPLFLRRHSETF